MNHPFLSPDHHGTFFDIQLPVNKKLSLSQALNYRHVNDFVEGLEDEHGRHRLFIREQPGGAGSRQAARELRNLIQNIPNDGVTTLTLDFEGQSVVSSSFADEVVVNYTWIWDQCNSNKGSSWQMPIRPFPAY